MMTVQLAIRGRHVLVVGGGAVAERRIGTLLTEGAKVTVLSPEVTPQIATWAESGKLIWRRERYEGGTLPKALLVLAVTNQPMLNEQIAVVAAEQGALVNRADKSSACDVTFPAVTQVGPIRATISTDTSPRVNRLLRMDFSERYAAVGDVLPALAAYREEVKGLLETSQDREAFWQVHLTLEDIRSIINGNWNKVEESIQGAISSIRDQS